MKTEHIEIKINTGIGYKSIAQKGNIFYDELKNTLLYSNSKTGGGFTVLFWRPISKEREVIAVLNYIAKRSVPDNFRCKKGTCKWFNLTRDQLIDVMIYVHDNPELFLKG